MDATLIGFAQYPVKLVSHDETARIFNYYFAFQRNLTYLCARFYYNPKFINEAYRMREFRVTFFRRKFCAKFRVR